MRLLLSMGVVFCLFLVDTLVERPILNGGAVYAGIEKIKPPKDKNKLSISYRPNGREVFPTKYNITLGVLPVRDRRLMKFYGGSDDFFIDNIVEAVNNSLYFELKFSQIFRNVRRLSQKTGVQLDTKQLASAAQQSRADLVFVTDLTKFNLLRQKMTEEKNGIDYQVIISFELVGQLIEPKSGKILWAEQIRRDIRTLNTTGEVLPNEYTANAIAALQTGFSDLKQLISATGMEIAR